MGALFALFSGRPAHQATIASSPMLGWSPELITDLTLAALRGPAREQHFLYLIAADDDFGCVTRHFAEYAAMLRKQAPSWLRWSVETRANEGHVPEVDLPLALRALFKGYNPEQPLLDADAFRSHYLELGRRWGFPIDPPGALLFDVGYDLVTAGDVEKGRRIFEYFAEAHPSAASAHAGLGFAYSRLGDRTAAERALKKALELDPENHLARRLLGELER